MAQDMKKVLIVDDNMVDRTILKAMLEKTFEVIEADSGNKAFEHISTKGGELDAILLDLSMPHIDGFDVLNFMREKGIDEIPVFVVTTEGTKQNVMKAFQYNISGFIKKPFAREDVLERLRSRVGVIPEYDLTKEELLETMNYIDDLKIVYKAYLSNFEKSDIRYKRRSDLMKIMLETYSNMEGGKELNPDSIDLISKAAYFCDIGEMMIPEGRKESRSNASKNQEMEERHTILGSDLIRLNKSRACRYFVEVCASMCLHHHERYDGGGYPYRIKGKRNAIYNQICRVLDELEEKRSKFYDDNAKSIKVIISHVVTDGMSLAGEEVYELLKECEPQIIRYYQ